MAAFNRRIITAITLSRNGNTETVNSGCIPSCFDRVSIRAVYFATCYFLRGLTQGQQRVRFYDAMKMFLGI